MRDISLIRKSVLDLAGQRIDLEAYKSLSLNSYERNYILQYLDDEAFLYVCDQYNSNLSQVSPYPSTYEACVLAKLFPELIERMKAKA